MSRHAMISRFSELGITFDDRQWVGLPRAPRPLYTMSAPAKVGKQPKSQTVNRDVALSVELVRSVPLYLDFLERHTLKAELENEHTLSWIVNRYENFWLPLLNDWKISDLEPPDDVRWVWHLHLLMPRHYIKFCRDRFGRVLPHKLRASHSDELSAMDRTRAIWRDRYAQESYDLDLKNRGVAPKRSSLTDVLQTSSRERLFLHQVSIPHYKDEKFLHKALQRYKKFLLLHDIRLSFSINPPMDIQLMWRTHLMYPEKYLNDVSQLLGRVLDFYADMTSLDGHIFIGGSSKDSEVWKSTYGETLFTPGTGYRGNPSHKAISRLPPDCRWARSGQFL